MESISMNEVWKQHPDYDFLWVSNLCRFKRVFKTVDHILKTEKQRCRLNVNGCMVTINKKEIMDTLFPEMNYQVHKEIVIPDLEGEIWKEITHLGNNLLVSNKGRVKKKAHYVEWDNKKMFINTLLFSQSFNRYKYSVIGMNINGKPRTMLVHTLVAKAFLPNPDNLPQVNHKDGIKSNNEVENLEWCTASHNIKHAWDNKLRSRKLKLKTTTNSQGQTVACGKYLFEI